MGGRLQGKRSGSHKWAWVASQGETTKQKEWNIDAPPQRWLHFSVTRNSLQSLGSSWRFKPLNTTMLYEHQKSVLGIWCYGLAIWEGITLQSRAFLWCGKGSAIPGGRCFDVLSGQWCAAAFPSMQMPEDLALAQSQNLQESNFWDLLSSSNCGWNELTAQSYGKHVYRHCLQVSLSSLRNKWQWRAVSSFTDLNVK